ncbi:transmembrane sensor [Catalinimonas alkaloidigena]|uniref:FecR family protein n=1 Tax=Catalinimonas alkaloidigena TaxID=1075417 RepID=UPI00240607EA|nr:FecR domain-containing protein [Catalinimonas alkaloidigena]MDF9796430.1 transmembrane sensor [Catalinimonas alkaloidigena]
MINYKNFGVEDFLADEYFRKWVYQENESIQNFWINWLEENPEKRFVVEEARQILRKVRFQYYPASKADLEEVWSKIESRRSKQGSVGPEITHPFAQAKKDNFRKRRMLIGLAASLLIGALLLVYQVRDKDHYETYSTAYGQTRDIMLPDRTRISLNANSSLKFNKGWRSIQKREVWLDGEAFFEVEKIQNSEGENISFLVHTGEMEVEVLGTRFNVNARRGKTEVVLNSGEVKLNLAHEKEPEVWMTPGDMVVFAKNEKVVHKKQVNPSDYSSWRNNMLVFNGSSLSEVKSLLEDFYGYEVLIQDEVLLERRFTGRFPSDKVALMLDALEASLGIQINENDHQIIMDTR